MKALTNSCIFFVTFSKCICVTALVFNSDVYYIDDLSGFGRRFDGIGGISGGGATSKLLINYPEPHRSDILDYLFKPQFGASLHILKVEIGGDGQSTDGSEASHQHYSWDENYSRGYEWWLMTEAKQRNPNIKIYGLPWSFPGWLNPAGKRSPYTDPVATSGYIIKWIHGAYTHYNVTVDFVGIWNENNYNKFYIKTLRQELDKAGLTHVKIVAPDAPHINDWKICTDMLKDPELAAAIEAVGCHYPGTITTQDAVKTHKPLWASEDYSTVNNIVGGGCWARILNENYVNGNITATISWNLIAAYYEKLPFTRDGLMTAESPWSGHYVVSSPVWMAAHTTQFTQIGWHYYRHGYGSGHFNNGGSYVTLTSPDRKDLTIVIETMSHDHSKCIRPPLPKFNVTMQKVTFKLKGQFASLNKLYMWKSILKFDGTQSKLFIRQTSIPVLRGSFSLNLYVDEVVTLTTVSNGNRGQHSLPPPPAPFPVPYREDFEKYVESMEPFNFAQQTGSFEVKDTGEGHGKVMRQMVIQLPIFWCAVERKLNLASNIIGSNSWTDISIKMDARIGNVNGTDGFFLGVRVEQGGCVLNNGLFLFIYPADKKFFLSNNLARTSILKSGAIGDVDVKGWNTVSLSVKGQTVTSVLNDNILFNFTTTSLEGHGFVGLGTANWGIADFDNIEINKP